MYQLKQMTQGQAEVIAYEWKYDGEYHFYDMDQDEEDLALFLDPKEREGKVFAVQQKDDLVGFLSVDLADGEAEIGFGIRPDLTGQGRGRQFVSFLVEQVQELYHPAEISLAVAAFNRRAIIVYERIGFRETEQFSQPTNGSVYPFVRMVLERRTS